MSNRVLFVVPLMVLAAAGSAQVVEVGQFTGSLFEDFNSFSTGEVGPSVVFMGGAAVNNAAAPSDIWMSDNHGLGGSKASYTSSMAMVANNGNQVSPWEISFTTAVSSFGGMWQSAYDDSTLTFQFFDTNNVALNTITKTPPNSGTLTWYGFSYAPGISKVLVTSDQQYQIVDDFTANAVPEPATMAALGLGVAAMIRRRKRA